MGKYRRLGKNAILMFLGNAGSKLLVFFMLPYYTTWLSVEDYGTVDLIQVYVSLLIGICTCCLTEAIFVFPKGQPITKQQTYFTSGSIFAVIALCMTGLLFILLIYIFRYWSFSGIFTQYNACIFLMLCTSFLQTYTQQFARSIDKVNVYVTSGLVLTISTVISSLFTLPRWGIYGYIYSLVFSYLVSAIYTIIAASEYRYFIFRRLSKASLWEMLRYSIPMIPNTLMWWILSTMNRPLLEYYTGLKAVGIMAVANKFPLLLSMLYSVFTYSWQISVLEEFGKEDYPSFYNKMFRIQFFVFSLFVIGIAFLGRPIIEIMTTPDFYGAWHYIALLSLSVAISNLAGFVGTTFLATKESKYYFSTSLWGGLACLALNFLLIPSWGIWGAVVSIMVANSLIFILRLRITRRYSPIIKGGGYIIGLLVVVIAIALSFVTHKLWINMIWLCLSIGTVLFMNRQVLYEGLRLCTKFKK